MGITVESLLQRHAVWRSDASFVVYNERKQEMLAGNGTHCSPPWAITSRAFELGVCQGLESLPGLMTADECLLACGFCGPCLVYHFDADVGHKQGRCWLDTRGKAECVDQKAIDIGYQFCTFGSAHTVAQIATGLSFICAGLIASFVVVTLAQWIQWLCSRSDTTQFQFWRFAECPSIKRCLHPWPSPIEKDMQNARVRLAAAVSHYGCVVCIGYLTMPTGLNFIVNAGTVDLQMTFLLNSDIWIALWASVFMLIGRLRGSMVTPSNLDRIQIFMSLIFAWRYCTMSGRNYIYNCSWMYNWRLFLGLVCGKAPLSIGLNIGMTAVDMLSYSFVIGGFEVPNPSLAAKAVSSETFNKALLREVFNVLAMSTLFLCAEQAMRQRIIATHQTKQLNKSLFLVQRLLGSMCDAVVHLDSELRVAKTCPQLDILLMRSKGAMLGQKLEELIVDTDRTRFQEFVEAEAQLHESQLDPGEGPIPMAKAFHCSFRGPYNSEVPMEFFVSCVEGVDGERS